MYKAVIFDLDGTLLDTLKDIAISANKVLEELGREQRELSEYNYLVGQGALVLMQNLLRDEDESLHVKALELFEKYYAIQYDKNTKMYEGINKVLTFFSARKYKMAILSNKPNKFTKKCALKYLKAWNFEAVYGIRKHVERKPSPQGVFEILKELDVNAKECLFVGDTKVDMQTAKNAGLTSIGVLWGFREKKELLENGANYIVKEPIEIIKLIATMENIKRENG